MNNTEILAIMGKHHQDKSGRYLTHRRAGSSDNEEDMLPPLVPKRWPVCQCCFEEILRPHPFRCKSGSHSFCRDCLKRYCQAFVAGEPYHLLEVETRDGASKLLPCLATDCPKGYFPHEVVQQSSDPETWEAYQEKMFQVMSVADTGRESESDLVDIAITKALVMHGQEFYSDSSLQDFEEDSKPRALPSKKKLASSPFKKEQAFTASLDQQPRTIQQPTSLSDPRECPKCRTRFLRKSGTCNKIRCPLCSSPMCYQCNKKILSGTDSSHFCNHSYNVCDVKCGKCVLWTSPEKDTAHS